MTILDQDTKKVVDPVGKLLNPDLLAKDQKYLDLYKQLFRNGGCLDNGTKFKMKDLFQADDVHTRTMRDTYGDTHGSLTERSLLGIVHESVDPGTYLQDYLTTVQLNGAGRIALIPSVGATEARIMAEGESYPEDEVDMELQTHVSVTKVGTGFKMTEDQIKHDAFDVAKKNAEAMGRALNRRKEKYIFDEMMKTNNVPFDNLDTLKRSTRGRNYAGQLNGTITTDDIAVVQEEMLKQGYLPDTIIVHPRAWIMFLEKRLSRALGLDGGAAWSAAESGDPMRTNASRVAGVAPGFPSSWNIVITTAVDYVPAVGTIHQHKYQRSQINGVTDVIFCDSKAAGLLIDTSNGVQVNSYKDFNRDITKFTAHEHYGLSINPDAVAVMKSVTSQTANDIAGNALGLITPLAAEPITGDYRATGIYTGNW